MNLRRREVFLIKYWLAKSARLKAKSYYMRRWGVERTRLICVPRVVFQTLVFPVIIYHVIISQRETGTIASPSVQREHLAPALLLFAEIFGEPTADLSEC